VQVFVTYGNIIPAEEEGLECKGGGDEASDRVQPLENDQRNAISKAHLGAF
jgi:hypothetical protein